MARPGTGAGRAPEVQRIEIHVRHARSPVDISTQTPDKTALMFSFFRWKYLGPKWLINPVPTAPHLLVPTTLGNSVGKFAT